MSSFCKKHLFSLDGVHYLNGAYMAPLSRAVEQAGIAGMRRKCVPTVLKSNHFFDETNEIRRKFSRVINAPSMYDIAVLPSVSYGMAIIANNTNARPGQNVLIVEGEFPSNVYVWQKFCARHGLELRIVPAPPAGDGRGAAWNEAIIAAIDDATALVSIGNVHWLDGTLFHVADIARCARRVGAAFIVDGTQSIGILPFDVTEVQPDAVITAGYKWLMGPLSIAVGYFGARYVNGNPLEENWLNRVKSEDFANLINYQAEYRPGAVRFDVGQSSNFVLAPMLSTALGQVLEWGVENIAEYSRRLIVQIAAAARDLGFGVSADGDRGPHFVGLSVPPDLDIGELAVRLAQANVAVSIRGQFVRVTAGVYNDEDDVRALARALEDYSSAARPRRRPSEATA